MVALVSHQIKAKLIQRVDDIAQNWNIWPTPSGLVSSIGVLRGVQQSSHSDVVKRATIENSHPFYWKKNTPGKPWNPTLPSKHHQHTVENRTVTFPSGANEQRFDYSCFSCLSCRHRLDNNHLKQISFQEQSCLRIVHLRWDRTVVVNEASNGVGFTWLLLLKAFNSDTRFPRGQQLPLGDYELIGQSRFTYKWRRWGDVERGLWRGYEFPRRLESSLKMDEYRWNEKRSSISQFCVDYKEPSLHPHNIHWAASEANLPRVLESSGFRILERKWGADTKSRHAAGVVWGSKRAKYVGGWSACASLTLIKKSPDVEGLKKRPVAVELYRWFSVNLKLRKSFAYFHIPMCVRLYDLLGIVKRRASSGRWLPTVIGLDSTLSRSDACMSNFE